MCAVSCMLCPFFLSAEAYMYDLSLGHVCCHCFFLNVFINGAVCVSLPGCQRWNSSAAARSARSWTIRTVCLAKVQQLRFISALHCSLEQMQYHKKEKGHVVNPRGPLTGKILNPGKQITVMEMC